MDRKEFIKTCRAACTGGGAVAFLDACSPNYYAASTVSNNRITVQKSEFTQVKKDKSVIRKYVLVRIDRFGFPIYLSGQTDGQYQATLLECTHKGCEVEPHGEFLQCPCHGSEYSLSGEVQHGPAERNLPSYKTTSDDANIYIYV